VIWGILFERCPDPGFATALITINSAIQGLNVDKPIACRQEFRDLIWRGGKLLPSRKIPRRRPMTETQAKE